MSQSPSIQKLFSHLYVEEKAKPFELCQIILERFSKSTVVSIQNYKEVFSRPRQRWDEQRQSRKLILAVKPNDFLYPGSAVTPDFGFKNFFYNSLILNCVYDCHYCYLQGLYPSGNVVVFVNEEDFYRATEEKLKILESIYLCISYDTDLLAFEGIVPYASRWVQFAQKHPTLTIELRTKSAHFSALSELCPPPNVILAWTLSPSEVIEHYEPLTPPLHTRLKSLKQAVDAGWRVRICIDPILAVPNWRTAYTELVSKIFDQIDGSKLNDVSLGVFRMNRDYFKNAQRARHDSDLFFQQYVDAGKVLSYEPSLKEDLIGTVRNEVKKFVASERVFEI